MTKRGRGGSDTPNERVLARDVDIHSCKEALPEEAAMDSVSCCGNYCAYDWLGTKGMTRRGPVRGERAAKDTSPALPLSRQPRWIRLWASTKQPPISQ